MTDKLAKLYHLVEKLLKQRVDIDPIYLGNDNPAFVEMFLEKNVQLDGQTYISENIRQVIKRDFTHIYLVGMRHQGSNPVSTGPGRPPSAAKQLQQPGAEKGGLDIKIWYFTNGPFMPSDRERVKRIFKRTIAVRSLLGMSDNVRDSLVFYIFPTECKKELPLKRGVPLGPNECNTGATHVGKSEIMLWRIEEMDKVLLHELLHHFRVDENLHGLDEDQNKQDKIHFNESYTEWLTTVLYTMFSVLEQSNPSYPRFKRALEEQQDYALKQAAKVTYHYKMKNVEEGVFNAANVPFQQHTHAYEYYILKAALLLHSEMVIEFVDLGTLRFVSGKQFMNVVSSCLDADFIEKVNEILRQNIRYNRTLRMVL